LSGACFNINLIPLKQLKAYERYISFYVHNVSRSVMKNVKRLGCPMLSVVYIINLIFLKDFNMFKKYFFVRAISCVRCFTKIERNTKRRKNTQEFIGCLLFLKLHEEFIPRYFCVPYMSFKIHFSLI